MTSTFSASVWRGHLRHQGEELGGLLAVLGRIARRFSLRASIRARPSGLPPSTMSVPRPAMLVAMVTAPLRPAWAMISASLAWCLALSTTWRDLGRLQGLGQLLAALDAGGAHQHRLALGVQLLDLLDDGLLLARLAGVDGVGEVGADHRHVGGDDHHFQLVDLQQFARLGLGGAGHAGEGLVHPEEVLEGDGGQRLVLGVDLDPLLGLDGLVQAVGPAPARHHAAR